MTHDEFVGQVQHRAHLPSRGDAERIIRATLETLGDRLLPHAAEHLAAQLPRELAHHLKDRHFEHLSLKRFYERVAEREGSDVEKAAFHVRCVFDILRLAVSAGAMQKLRLQLPEEFLPLFDTPKEQP